MSYPSLRLVRSLADEPSALVLLLTRFGCKEHPDHGAWLRCPDGVKRHAYFDSHGEPSAEALYLTWDVPVLSRTTTVSISGPSGEVLDERESSTTVRMGIRQLLAHYGEPRSEVLRQWRLTFNGAPARTVRTYGRLASQVERAHRREVAKALRDRAVRERWREDFSSVPEPGGRPYELPVALRPAPAPGPPRRKEFAPAGFEPGIWFSWVDQRDGVVYDCQILAPTPRPCHVWIVGHPRGGQASLTWLAELNFPGSHRGGRTARQATSLTVLAGDGGHRALATVEAPQSDRQPLLA